MRPVSRTKDRRVLLTSLVERKHEFMKIDSVCQADAELEGSIQLVLYILVLGAFVERPLAIRGTDDGPHFQITTLDC